MTCGSVTYEWKVKNAEQMVAGLFGEEAARGIRREEAQILLARITFDLPRGYTFG